MSEMRVRTCCWKLPDGRHTLNCPQRCWDCKGDVDGPNRCECGDGIAYPLHEYSGPRPKARRA
jgi:hypothetical protein